FGAFASEVDEFSGDQVGLGAGAGRVVWRNSDPYERSTDPAGYTIKVTDTPTAGHDLSFVAYYNIVGVGSLPAATVTVGVDDVLGSPPPLQNVTATSNYQKIFLRANVPSGSDISYIACRAIDLTQTQQLPTTITDGEPCGTYPAHAGQAFFAVGTGYAGQRYPA